ncbi:hypothetical protein JVU11DRAFT_74 [Chiua virens]|nr:hypothetical protein JVU11DRAFT_74 [Chiua virens]
MASHVKRMFSLRTDRTSKTEQPVSPTAVTAPVTPVNGIHDHEILKVETSVAVNGMEAAIATLPSFDELPKFHAFTGCAWDVWGKDDQLGTINMLTEDVVQRAAREEIRSGKTVSLNWYVQPVFGRQNPSITTFSKYGPSIPVRDDVIHINTQSGSQWDGLKHYGLTNYNVFYNKCVHRISVHPNRTSMTDTFVISTPAESLSAGEMEIHDPSEIDHARVKLGMHNWSNHGICGRGVLLDLVEYYTASGSALPYDPWTTHPISVAELEACAKKQGVTFRQADILIIRMGFIQKFYTASNEAKAALRDAETLCVLGLAGASVATLTVIFLLFARVGVTVFSSVGVEQSEDMKRFLWNNHFAAVASDQPSFEVCLACCGREHELTESFVPVAKKIDIDH